MGQKNFLLILVCLFSFGAAFGQETLKTVEAEANAVYNSGKLRVAIPFENGSRQRTTAARLRVELLDAHEKIVARGESGGRLAGGRNIFAATLDVANENKARDLLWQRIRYSLEAGGEKKSGTIALSEIMPELFRLRVSAADEIYAGMKYPVRVRAFHPTKDVSIVGVDITAKLKIDLETEDDEDELIIKASGKTDAEGFAVLEFEIPAGVKFNDDYSGEIEVLGVKNGLVAEADEDLETGKNNISVYFTTDKPLYQPGQKIFARALAMQKNKADSGLSVVAGKEFEFSIRDEDETLLFRRKITSSRFGVAALEWQIPENAKLGSYRISADSEDDELDADQTSFKVSRYELPNFVVQTRADKDFYLPGENTAEVTVDALYLFGKPVTSGRVRVVRESSREWNYREQKWDVEEGTPYEGEAGADGKYTARIDLSKEHEKLREDETDKFEDLHFTAYYTDFSTNKTEQRRFDVRVTKEPIHLYLEKGRGGDNNPKLPLTLYVSALTADGKPCAACRVEISGKYEDEDDSQTKPLAAFQTNARGAGKAEFPAPKRADGIYADDLEFKVVARDAENRIGTSEFEYAIDEDEKQLVVRTDKTIYRQGEPLKIEILASDENRSVFVDVLKNASSLASRRVKLTNGRAELRIPFNPAFKSFLTVSAFYDDEGEAVEDSRRIVYPSPRNLRVTTQTNKDEFRPNEEAALGFKVSTADNKQTEAALGVVILDQAVEERAKTDALFGGGVNIFEGIDSLGINGWDELDMKQLSPELQLAAEMGFANFGFENNIFGSDFPVASTVFEERLKKQFEAVDKALKKRYDETFEHPTDDASLRRILSGGGVDFDALRDPWGTPFRAVYDIYYRSDVVVIKSAGANKVFGDRDDFDVTRYYFEYFKKTGSEIDKAIGDYVRKTGKFVRDTETLRAALAEKDIDLDSIKDRWGNPYKIVFGIYGRKYTVVFESGGSQKNYNYNFVVWSSETDYFAEAEAKIGEVLTKFIAEKQTFPQTEEEFKAILKAGGVDFDALRDGWDRPFYLVYEARSQFADKVIIENVAPAAGGAAKETLSITPVTRRLGIFHIRSFGDDGVRSDQNYNDVWVATFAGIISEQRKEDAKPKLVVPKTAFVNGKSAIYGVVSDMNGAVIPNAEVVITNSETNAAYQARTNAEGVYLQTNLAAGKYSVRASATGFKTTVINELKLAAEQLAEANFTLEAGAVSEIVTVSADSTVTIDPGDTKIDTNITRQLITDLPKGTQFVSLLKISPNVRPESLSGGFQIDGASGAENNFVVDRQEVTNFRSGTLNKKNELPAAEQKTTPRLREYFPETLLWIPELVTDKTGKISIKFRLADNITTWRIYAVASDAQGRIGVTGRDIKAFQPFFVDLEPPKFLTDGDEIHLPSQVRNYTPASQKVDVTMGRADLFSMLSPDRQAVEVASGASGSAVFGFKAIAPVKDGRQRVTALAAKDADAIEKPVTVRPNGREIVRAESKLFKDAGAFDVDFPAGALPKTPQAELKIYPNLMAHVTEAVEGLLQRPYGCGEQTISSTYPNLMILKFKTDSPNSALEQKARKYLQKGYERLLGYQSADGGFSYWGGKSESDIALTAYALRFLSDARTIIEVDPKII